MKKRFSVGTARFKTNYDLFKTLLREKLVNMVPKFIEALCRISEKKWFSFFPIGSSAITNVKAFTNIYRYNHCSGVDSFDFFSFTGIHGYAPLLIFANQLATGLSQDEYSLFHLTARLTGI